MAGQVGVLYGGFYNRAWLATGSLFLVFNGCVGERSKAVHTAAPVGCCGGAAAARCQVRHLLGGNRVSVGQVALLPHVSRCVHSEVDDCSKKGDVFV